MDGGSHKGFGGGPSFTVHGLEGGGGSGREGTDSRHQPLSKTRPARSGLVERAVGEWTHRPVTPTHSPRPGRLRAVHGSPRAAPTLSTPRGPTDRKERQHEGGDVDSGPTRAFTLQRERVPRIFVGPGEVRRRHCLSLTRRPPTGGGAVSGGAPRAAGARDTWVGGASRGWGRSGRRSGWSTSCTSYTTTSARPLWSSGPGRWSGTCVSLTWTATHRRRRGSRCKTTTAGDRGRTTGVGPF